MNALFSASVFISWGVTTWQTASEEGIPSALSNTSLIVLAILLVGIVFAGVWLHRARQSRK